MMNRRHCCFACGVDLGTMLPQIRCVRTCYVNCVALAIGWIKEPPHDAEQMLLILGAKGGK
jgi:hypothetical protein